MRTLRTFLIIVIMFFCAITASAQKPLTKPEKPVQTAPATKSSSGTTSKSTSISEPTGYTNGHGYVDLGLSVKWATCNVGATSPSDYGNYYAWGETRPKSEYTVENSITYGKNMGSIAGNSTYDVARANWGGTWRLPTKEEMEELVKLCKYKWTTQEGHKGYKIIGPNGNSIFLPASGARYGNSLNSVGAYGGYWGATAPNGDVEGAYCLYLSSEYFDRLGFFRYEGQSVRPVSE